jgi:4-hydroxy-tetrahydrodipicolinate synthase
MITPFTDDGELDLDGAQRLAGHLVDEGGNDGLVLNGTTGEAPTTTDAEKEALIRAVLEAVGDRATVVAGAGTNDTRHTVELAQSAEKAGAHGLLVVTPYYNKPPQSGLLRHFTTVADATGLPVMLYDIPFRTGTPIEVDTLVRLAEHPRIKAVKDAKGSIADVSWTMHRTDLAYYSGDDMMNLPLLSLGAVGFVSVVGHIAGIQLRDLLDAYESGNVAKAAEIHSGLLPVYSGIFRTQGAILVKAALTMFGLPAGPMRLPLVDATDEQVAVLVDDLKAAGLRLPGTDQ